ncbi:CxC2 domain-containing protein [Mycena venus]|uniref:CxC2 domain-containing protein n=1 Tax=Mycena venus TaxID=2733690 RepID=A0A8H6X6L5_9AGAR|nr:CxC2 domain-containing protein [Mycena venus]
MDNIFSTTPIENKQVMLLLVTDTNFRLKHCTNLHNASKYTVGNTDGESPERYWASLNSTGTSTKEMGPGSRRDVRDDACDSWNLGPKISAGDIKKENLQIKDEREVKKLVVEEIDK